LDCEGLREGSDLETLVETRGAEIILTLVSDIRQEGSRVDSLAEQHLAFRVEDLELTCEGDFDRF